MRSELVAAAAAGSSPILGKYIKYLDSGSVDFHGKLSFSIT